MSSPIQATENQPSPKRPRAAAPSFAGQGGGENFNVLLDATLSAAPPAPKLDASRADANAAARDEQNETTNTAQDEQNQTKAMVRPTTDAKPAAKRDNAECLTLKPVDAELVAEPAALAPVETVVAVAPNTNVMSQDAADQLAKLPATMSAAALAHLAALAKANQAPTTPVATPVVVQQEAAETQMPISSVPTAVAEIPLSITGGSHSSENVTDLLSDKPVLEAAVASLVQAPQVQVNNAPTTPVVPTLANKPVAIPGAANQPTNAEGEVANNPADANRSELNKPELSRTEQRHEAARAEQRMPETRGLPFAGIIHQPANAGLAAAMSASQLLQAMPQALQQASGASAATNSGAVKAVGDLSPTSASSAGFGRTSEAGYSKTAKPLGSATPSVQLEQVSFMLKRQVKQGQELMTLQLRPEALGKVEIKMEWDAGRVRALIVAETPMALEALKADSAGLQRALADVTAKGESSLEFQLKGEQQQAQQQRDYRPTTMTLAGLFEAEGTMPTTEAAVLTSSRVNIKI